MEALTTKPVRDVDLSQPVLRKPMAREDLLSAMLAVLEGEIPLALRSEDRAKAIRYNDVAGCLKVWGQFLNTLGDGPFNPNEALLGDFLKYVTQERPNWKEASHRNVPFQIRRLINGLPPRVLNRPLLSSREVGQATRFDGFSPATKTALQSFLADGRWVKQNGGDKPNLTTRLLSDSYRRTATDDVVLLLKTLGKTDVLQITAADTDRFLQVYDAKGKRQLAVNMLADMQPFFNNLRAKGLIDRVPFVGIVAKSTAINDDFVMPEQLAVLADISKVDLKDIVEVRDRLLAVGLLYDFALRVGEVIRLKVSDVAIEKFVELTIRTEIQKGQGKPTKTFLSFFPETKILMDAYLKLRGQKAVSHDALIITESGGPLMESGCRAAVQQLCQRLGVKTAKGDVPAPHRFRHSFGTCNVAPLGLRLDVYGIMKRLRHTSIELTNRTYISDNPLLSRAKHDEHVRVLTESKASDAARSSPPSMLRTGSTTITARGGTVTDAGAVHADDGQACSVTEQEALRLLAPLGFICMSLRMYAKGKGLAEKRKGAWFYSLAFIDDLSQNYFTKQEAMKIIGFGKSAFFYWVTTHGIEQLVIGKVSLVKKDAVLAKSRAGEFRKSA